MTVGTMDGKTSSAVEQPSVTIIRQAEENAGKKSRVTRKHVIIAVTCTVVLAMVIAGILVGVKFHLDNTHKIVTHTLEFKVNSHQKVKEDISADVKDNYVMYHLKDDDSEVTVIDDFNRELQVMKVTYPEGSKCFISVLNTSDNALPAVVLNATATDEILETDDKFYDSSETAVKDKSMLGSHGQKLCNNLEAYWITQTCDVDKDTTTSTDMASREKRGLWSWAKKQWKRLWCWVTQKYYICIKCRRSCKFSVCRRSVRKKC